MVTLLILFGLAVLAVEIAYHSSLAYDVKFALRLTEDRLPKVGALASWKFWKQFLPRWIRWLAFIPIIIFTIFYKIIQWLACPYCQSAWYGFFYGLFLNKNIIECLAMGGITVFFVYIVELVAKHVES